MDLRVKVFEMQWKTVVEVFQSFNVLKTVLSTWTVDLTVSVGNE